MARKITDNVVALFDDRADELPEMPLETMSGASSDLVSETGGAAVDLTGKPRIIMTFGAGRSGKSTLLRWSIDRAMAREGGSDMILASVDTERLTLKQFFPATHMPPSSDDAVAWLKPILSKVLQARRSIAIDFGADMTLLPILRQTPDLKQMMLDAGVEPVVFYMLSPRVSDLTVLKSMEASAFRPTATCIVLNAGVMPPHAKDPGREFAPLQRHSVYRAAIERGAVQVWMPSLFAAASQVENRGIGFRQAAAEGHRVSPPLNLFDQHAVAVWLKDMDAHFAPVASWLP